MGKGVVERDEIEEIDERSSANGRAGFGRGCFVLDCGVALEE